MNFKQIIILLTFVVLFGTIVNAQMEEAELDSLIDDFIGTDKYLYDLFDGNINFHFLYVNSSYTSQTTFQGREIADNLFNYSGQVYYFISNGLYLGISGAWYSQIEPGYRATSLTAGYSNGTNKLRYRLTYNRYIYNIPNYVPNFANAFNIGSTFKPKNTGIRFDYSLLFGKEFNHQISVDLFSKIKILSLGGYDKIRFEPEISFDFNSEVVETDIGLGNPDDPFYIPDYQQKEKFGLLNTQLRFPITIDYKDFMLDVSYNYNFPLSLDENYSYPNSHFFKISLGYIFTLN